MNEDPWLSVDVKSLSDERLVEIALQLDGSEHVELVDSLRRELIKRLKAMGKTTQDIIKYIVLNVYRGRRMGVVVRNWARVLDVTVEEFRRIADVK